jgi:Fur family transcriptional regulator, peroxide stress response regulator
MLGTGRRRMPRRMGDPPAGLRPQRQPTGGPPSLPILPTSYPTVFGVCRRGVLCARPLTRPSRWYRLPLGNNMQPDEMAARLAELEQRCRRKGLPVTLQRRLILEAVLQRDDHPSADQIYEAVQDRIPQLSRTTVYRTLDTLLELGVIRRVHLTGATARFDGRIRRHHHLVCAQCGKIIDLQDEGLDQLPVPKRKLQGFAVDDFSVQFSGTCAECQKRGK